jgi:hypothetical protein
MTLLCVHLMLLFIARHYTQVLLLLRHSYLFTAMQRAQSAQRLSQ